MIDVVSAVIHRAGRILLTQRRHDKDFAWAWESPGGKVEDDETQLEALRRELREEIGVTFEKWWPEPLWSGQFRSDVAREDRRDIFLSFYGVEIIGEPRALEGQGIGWFDEFDVRGLHLAPANALAMKEIADWVRKQRKNQLAREVGSE